MLFPLGFFLFFFNDTATTEIYTLSLHDALPIWSVVQTWRLEQRAESPTEGREAVAGVEEGVVRERKESVHAQNIYGVIDANGNLDAGYGPAELDSRGAVKHAICCAEKQRLGGAQPVGKQQA